MKTLIAVLPYLLSALSLMTIVTIWLGRKAILRGDWSTHRNYMVTSLALFATTLILFCIYLWIRGPRILVVVPEAMFGIYGVTLVTTIGMLALTLWRVAKHQYLPHKLLARKTVFVWLWCCLYSMLFYPLTDAQITPL